MNVPHKHNPSGLGNSNTGQETLLVKQIAMPGSNYLSPIELYIACESLKHRAAPEISNRATGRPTQFSADCCGEHRKFAHITGPCRARSITFTLARMGHIIAL
jgi:hypothetical protein